VVSDQVENDIMDENHHHFSNGSLYSAANLLFSSVNQTVKETNVALLNPSSVVQRRTLNIANPVLNHQYKATLVDDWYKNRV
jgi:hypothetical protein